MKQTKPEVEFVHSQKEYDINIRKKKFTIYINNHKDQKQKETVYFEGHAITDRRVINDLLRRIANFKKFDQTDIKR